MSSVPDRARHLESIISTCLLAVLFLIGIGVFIKQSDYDMSRLGISAAIIELSSQQSVPTAEEKPVLASLKPQGFNTLSETEVYDSENLYEKINGKAPLYIDSGFVKLLTHRFVSDSDQDLWMELFVFDMADIRNAFSIYSVQKRSDSEILPDMQFGYKTSNSLYFAHGKYYIELLGSSESDKLLSAMEQVADKIIGSFPFDKDTKIDELALLPQDNLVPGSAKLYLANAFGFEGLTQTFTAKYQLDDEAVTAFLCKKKTAADANEVFENYSKFLLDNGGKEIPTDNPKVRSIDFYGTLEIVSVIGPYVFGIHEAENPQLAGQVQKMMLNKLLKTTETSQNGQTK